MDKQYCTHHLEVNMEGGGERRERKMGDKTRKAVRGGKTNLSSH